MYVCHAPSNRFFFFVSRRNRAVFVRQFSMWHSTKRCSSIFDLGPLTPKIYSPKFGTKSPISRLVWQIDRRSSGLLWPTGFSGIADSMEPYKMLWGRPLLTFVYTVSGKKRTNSVLGITSLNTGRFPKFFQCRNLLEIRNKTVIKFPTTPQTRRYTTL